MIILCSPAKTMRTSDNKGNTIPMFIEDAKAIVDKLKLASDESMAVRFGVNSKLASKICCMYKQWDDEGTCCALDSFNGLQFKQLDSLNLTPSQRQYAYEHLYILSGLYGILKASDNISAYRLDLRDGIDIINLYQDRILTYLKGKTCLNLTSKEYSDLIDDYGVKVSFLNRKKDKLVNLATYSKMQRGKMLKYCIENEIADISDIKSYNKDGYVFNEELSSDECFVFVKEEE